MALVPPMVISHLHSLLTVLVEQDSCWHHVEEQECKARDHKINEASALAACWASLLIEDLEAHEADPTDVADREHDHDDFQAQLFFSE